MPSESTNSPEPHLGRRVLTQRQQQRSRTIVGANTIACFSEQLAEQDLGDIVTARGELIEHLACRQQARFLELIEGA